jgi:hypothetical protein
MKHRDTKGIKVNKAVNESTFNNAHKAEALIRERLEAQGFAVGEIEAHTSLKGLRVDIALEKTVQLNALYSMELNLKQQMQRWLGANVTNVYWRYQPRAMAAERQAA